MSETETAGLYDVETIAKLLMISSRRVQQLVKEGVIPRADHGKYPLVGATQGYIRYLQNQLNAGAKKLDEDARLKAAQASLRELELQRARAELIPAAQVGEVLFEIVNIQNTALSAMASRISLDCVGRNAKEIKAIVSRECRAAQQRVSDALSRMASTVRERIAGLQAA